MGEEFINKLKLEINKGLPGWDAQKKLAPHGRDKERYKPADKDKFREGGVLIWLYPNKNKIYTRLIIRAEKGVHGGQVAFPGGKVEESDKDFWATALREANEEIGLPMDKITLVGALSPLYIIPSNFWVHPFIGWSNEMLPSTAHEDEVQSYFDIDILMLLQPDLKEDNLVTTGLGEQIIIPSYVLEGHITWGATAMMLSELEELVRRAL